MVQPKKTGDTELKMLKDTDLAVADYRQDIRGRRVLDNEGKRVGHVSSLFIDESERKIRMLDVSGGGFLGIGDQHFLVPVDAIVKVDDESVHISESADRVAKSPAYDPKLIVKYDRDYWGSYYQYYGGLPYWSNAYAYPDYHTWYDR
jgi:sporulation protein YlmC with PRC-barrel domain